ncbi:MAG: outer membrane lipoprotein carrier protein LolA [Xanthobacteraceae bacterium]|nr:MAG: outer membrane lipoprotein carrier protein LolA [Xanthobacteraceae bacterium]
MAGVAIGPGLPARAQDAIPIPRPAPRARDIAFAQNSQRPTPPIAIPAAPPMAQRSATPPTPVLPGPRPLATPGTLDAGQRALAGKVSAYLSSLGSLSGNFVQIGPDGGRTTGDFYIQKPGKVRFEYDPPSPIDVVADGSSVIVRDRKLATQDLYPLSQTPLRYLLSDRIDLVRDTNLVGVSGDDMFVTVVIEEKQALIGTSRLMMMLGAKDLQLKQWTVTDPQGYDTTVAVYNLDFSKKLDPALFKIDYTNYRN